MIRTDASTEDELRKAFAWITRNGMGPRFGSRPNGWYQMHQCAVLDVLRDHLGGHGEVRVVRGVVLGTREGMVDGVILRDGKRWIGLGSTRAVYNWADALIRKA